MPAFRSLGASDRVVTNPNWLSPEVLGQDEETTRSDVYSFGIVLWELVTREHPFDEYKLSWTYEIEDKIRSGGRPTIPATCPPAYRDLITRCWHQDSAQRPTFIEITHDVTTLIMSEAPDLAQELEMIYLFDGEVEPVDVEENQPTVEIRGSFLAKIPAPDVVQHSCLVGDSIWGGSTTGFIFVWDTKSGELSVKEMAHRDSVQCLILVGNKVWTYVVCFLFLADRVFLFLAARLMARSKCGKRQTSKTMPSAKRRCAKCKQRTFACSLVWSNSKRSKVELSLCAFAD